MSDEYFFSELRLNGKPLVDCELALECNETNYRLYVDRIQDENRFYCVAVEFVGCRSVEDDVWESKGLTVNQIFEAVAYFDGVRHLEFNRGSEEMPGYIYYPNIEGIIAMLSKLREIELDVTTPYD